MGIQQKIIEEFNGTINFESGDKGTTFWFELPVYYA